MAEPDEALRELLGAYPPASVLALDAATRSDLAEVIAEARRHQARGLAEAFEATLRHVPFPVRGVVKRVLGA
ncbi:MAG: hypothetical protein DLM58_06350 [Pseudonocardiales bacterium]|nr:MAG: hypothetical protein DLM58_06350 [Pseudonocardiales bacterium]